MSGSSSVTVADRAAEAGRFSPAREAWQRFCRNRLAVVGGVFLLGFLLVALLWPWIAPYPPDQLSDDRLLEPTLRHWFGTDVHGRDLLSRVLFGTRISLAAGAIGAGISLVIGVLWGSVAGYRGGRWDGVMMRFVDLLYALPTVVFVIVLLAVSQGITDQLRGGAFGDRNARLIQWCVLFAGLGAVSWLTMARIVRGQVLALRQTQFVEASLALGASHTRVLFRHILPHTAGIIIIYLALTVPSVMLYESFLSYLGLGVQPPQASLGSLLAEGATQINPIRTRWWLLLFPALSLGSLLLALNLLADGLRDALDPHAEP
jgi:ABC-type dipeptide/oligopeptide/nickel transport system permease subunit